MYEHKNLTSSTCSQQGFWENCDAKHGYICKAQKTE